MRRRGASSESGDNPYGLSLVTFNLILLCLFVYLVSRATPNSIRESTVIEKVRTHYGGKERLETLNENQVSVSQIKEIAQRAGFGILDGAGRYTLTLPGGKLFASGDDQISPEYVPTLRRIARIVAQLKLSARIVGHTDNKPLQGGRFRNNWELSAARAVSVLRIFTAAGVPEKRVSASGRAEFVPVASNKTEEGRASNRRVTIVVEAATL